MPPSIGHRQRGPRHRARRPFPPRSPVRAAAPSRPFGRRPYGRNAGPPRRAVRRLRPLPTRGVAGASRQVKKGWPRGGAAPPGPPAPPVARHPRRRPGSASHTPY
ncbi:hypothetical protein GCM10023082_61000 [Streptomyces tremellae]|uniref:Uncharacterized protein n=1 Tax=Streptomyces tremellae TaxID=1124239 RepID=A0ABP7GBI5_9ACTN